MAEETTQDPVAEAELDVLKTRAKELGINFHPNIGAETLSNKIKEFLDSQDEPAATEPAPAAEEKPAQTQGESEQERRVRKKKEAEKLVRIQVTCMDPKRKEWEGDIFTAGNTLLGSYRKFVPFNTPWHVPQIIYNQIKNAKCQVFYTKLGGPNGKVKVRASKLVNAFAVEVLPDLTEQELKDLAQRQAMADGTSE